MKYLIDTHTFLWAVSAKDKLSQSSRTLIEDNEIYISTASLWEIAIKISIGKLRFTSPYESFISQQLALNEFFILPASLKHYDAVCSCFITPTSQRPLRSVNYRPGYGRATSSHQH